MNILVGNLLRSLQLCWQIDYGTDGSVSRQGASDDYGYGARWLGVPVLRFHSIRMTKLNRCDCQNVSTPVALLFHCGRVSGRDSEVGVVKTFHCFD